MFRWRLARTVLVYLVVKYLRWKLRRILRQLDAAEAEATSRTRECNSRRAQHTSKPAAILGGRQPNGAYWDDRD